MKSVVKERLEDFLKFKKITKTEFGKRIGVSAAYVTGIRRSLSQEKISSIAREWPDLNIEWLLTGEGAMLKNQSGHTVVTGDVSGNGNQFVAGNNNVLRDAEARYVPDPKREDVEVIEGEEVELAEVIPVIPTDLAKAPGVDVQSLVMSGSKKVKRLSFAEFLDKFGEFDAVCPTYRDSMIPTYVPGDFLFIKYKDVTNDSYINQGRYLLDTREHGSILGIVEDTEDGWLTLSFKNARKYKPMRIKKEDVMSIADIVLMVRMGDMGFDVMNVEQMQQQLEAKDEQFRLLMEQYNKTGDRVNRVIDQNQYLIDALIGKLKKDE